MLPKYRLTNPVCSLLVHGLNDTYTVTANRKHYFLRVYGCAWRDRGEIVSEVDMLNYLHRRRQPVSHPIRRKDGAYLTRINAPEGARYAVLFSEATGTNPNFQKLAICRQYGEVVGRTKANLNADNFIQVDSKARKITISEIFKWYEVDFVTAGKTVLQYINQYRNKKIPEDYEVGFYQYDWTLNEIGQNR